MLVLSPSFLEGTVDPTSCREPPRTLLGWRPSLLYSLTMFFLVKALIALVEAKARLCFRQVVKKLVSCCQQFLRMMTATRKETQESPRPE